MGGAYQGTSWRRYKSWVGFLLEGKVVFNRSGDGAGGQVHGGVLRQGYVDGAAMGNHAIGSSTGAITAITDIAAGGADLDLGAVNAFKLESAAAGSNLHIATSDIGQHHGSGHAAHANVAIGRVLDRDPSHIGGER